jgi:hypothetical protein
MGTVYGTLFKSTGWVAKQFTSGTSLGWAVSTTTEPTNMIKTKGWRGVRMMFYGTSLATSGMTGTGMKFYRVEVDNNQNPHQYVTRQIFSFTSNWAAPTSGAADRWDGSVYGAWTSDQRLITRLGDGSTNYTATSLHTKSQQSVNGVTVVQVGTSGVEPAELWITDIANAYGITCSPGTTFSDNTLAGEAGILYQLER